VVAVEGDDVNVLRGGGCDHWPCRHIGQTTAYIQVVRVGSLDGFVRDAEVAIREALKESIAIGEERRVLRIPTPGAAFVQGVLTAGFFCSLQSSTLPVTG